MKMWMARAFPVLVLGAALVQPLFAQSGPGRIFGLVELSGTRATSGTNFNDSVKAKTVALIWVNNDFGKGGRDVFMKTFEPLGLKVVADVSTDPGQVDFSAAVLKARQANADALFVYCNEEESARALRELRKQ